MKVFAIIILCIFFTGCSNTEADKEFYRNYLKSCNGRMSTELHVGTWGKTFVVRCEDYDLNE